MQRRIRKSTNHHQWFLRLRKILFYRRPQPVQ